MTNIQVFYDGPIVKRSDALALGYTYYFTGKPCKHGHISKRQVANRSCYDCSRMGTGARMLRKYRGDEDYRNEFNLKRREYSRAYAAKRRLDEDYRRREIEANRKWVSENYDQKLSHNRSYRARFRGAEGTHTSDDVNDILCLQNNKCAEPTCGSDLSDGYHVDHIMPLKLGGSNWPKNLQCLCPSCNTRKHAMHPVDWARKNGRLC